MIIPKSQERGFPHVIPALEEQRQDEGREEGKERQRERKREYLL